uniref:Zgc:136858 n=2 Tax=Latimeria chalumnae TaxID=7897 RepID=M3XK43_LATCH
MAGRKDAVKVSRRDLPYVLSQGLSGGTTVSASMIIANKVGIPVFVTGGIGGVHRGGETSMDVSADLTELGRTPIAVVSAGVKSVLDIGRTLEYLETQGVCVATFGECNEFPAFFTPKSGHQSPYHVKTEEEAACLIASMLEFSLGSGVLVAVPIPECQVASGQIIEAAIQQAMMEASAKRIVGKEVTPFILRRVCELTRGMSLESNVALIKNNADVGSRIACALSRLGQGKRRAPLEHRRKPCSAHQPVVIGGTNVDFVAKAKCDRMVFGGQTNVGEVKQSFGGVGRNLADCLSRLSLRPLFISAVGTDRLAESVLSYCSHMDMSGVARLREHSTATYCAVIAGSGELSLGIGDMAIHQTITEQYVSGFAERLQSASLVCMDGNLPVSTVDYICKFAKEHHKPVWYEPTTESKANKPFLSDSWKSLTFTFPNLGELRAMNQALGLPVPAELPSGLDDVISFALASSHPLLEYLQCVVVTLGSHGVLLCGRNNGGSISFQLGGKTQNSKGEPCAVHYPAVPVLQEDILNVSGAGDCLAAGMIAGMLAGQETDTCVRMGLLAAYLSLRSHDSVPMKINDDSVGPEQIKARNWPEATYRWSN